MVELLPCPECGDVPEVGYACGEYFIMSTVHPVGECFCGNFTEMHSSEEKEIEVWNEAVGKYRSENTGCEACCHREDDGGYVLHYNGNKKAGEKCEL